MNKEVKIMKRMMTCISICMLVCATSIAMMSSVLAVENQPAAPTLTGPTQGKIGLLYLFSAQTIDPEGDFISYNFSWGEENYTGWIMPYVQSGHSVSADYSWNALGSYEVKVKAKDVYGHEGDWSTPITIQIINDPPEKPILTGPESGGIEALYTYLVEAADPNNDDVSYFIDWGDGTNSSWIPAVPSGTVVQDVHAWKNAGTYVVKVKAKDSYEDVSVWSENFTVQIGGIAIDSINGGFGVTVNIKNCGDISKDLEWTAELIGGSVPGFHLNKFYSGEITPLKPGEMLAAQTGSIFGLGRFKITVTVECPGEPTVTETVDGVILFFYVIIR